MPTLVLLQQPLILFPSIVILGLCVGSFLNVVISRLPIMLEREWETLCTESNQEAQPKKETYNLIVPRSSCPACGHKIRFYENIPLISYLLLKGRCSACRAPISLQYPLVELITAIISTYIVYHFGISSQAFWALWLVWALIALSVIDLKEMILPDKITLPVMWIGLLINMENTFISSQASIIGAAAGYLSLWSVYHVFKFLTKKEGMGYGDFKLLAMLGAWMGWQSLPLIILLSALAGSVIGISMVIFLKKDEQIPIPFGPYLAIAGLIYLLWGEQISQTYLNTLG